MHGMHAELSAAEVLTLAGELGLRINLTTDADILVEGDEAVIRRVEPCLRRNKAEIVSRLKVARPCSKCDCPGVWIDRSERRFCAGCQRWDDPCEVNEYHILCGVEWELQPHPAITELEQLFRPRKWTGRRLFNNGFPPRTTPEVPDNIRFVPGRGTPWNRSQVAFNRTAVFEHNERGKRWTTKPKRTSHPPPGGDLRFFSAGGSAAGGNPLLQATFLDT